MILEGGLFTLPWGRIKPRLLIEVSFFDLFVSRWEDKERKDFFGLLYSC